MNEVARDLFVIYIEPEVKAPEVNNGAWVKGVTSTLHDLGQVGRETEGS